MRTKEQYQQFQRMHLEAGEANYHLEVFGDYLAQREGYKAMQGLDAIHFYVMNKHHWMPAQVRAMTFDDLRFVLAQDLSGWTLPAESCV